MAHFDRFQSLDLVRKTNILSETIHKENKALLHSNAYVNPPKFFVNPFNKNSHQFVPSKVFHVGDSNPKSKEYLESISKITEPPESKSEVPLTSNQEIGFWVNHRLAQPLLKPPLVPLHYSDVVRYKSVYWKYHPQGSSSKSKSK